MNLALEKCEEYVDGVRKRSYGDAFVRGNNGMVPFLRKVLPLIPDFTVMYISAD
jgi:LSM domain